MYMIIYIYISNIFGTYTDIRSYNYLYEVSSSSTLVHGPKISQNGRCKFFKYFSWEVMKEA